MLEEPGALLRHGLMRTVKRGLLVECLAVEGDEAGRDEDAVVSKEHRGGRIDGEVSTRGVRGTHTTVRIGGPVRLAEEDVLTLELEGGGAIVVELEEGHLHLSGITVAEGGRHRLEPVAERGRLPVESPTHDSLRNLVRLDLVADPGVVLKVLRAQTLLLEVNIRDGTLEDVLAKPW